VRLAIVLVLILLAGVASAAPPEPSGPHPRMLLDAKLGAAWKAALKDGRGPLVGAVALCDEDRSRRDHDGALYMGAEWAKMLQACLVAWAATDKPEYGTSALKYFTALIDDLDKIGDGKGGDTAVARDSGYPIRNLGPYTAIAYDWLHDFPGMTPELRARARRRWAAWLTWFRDKGYHPRDPGSNYQAGYLISATLVAIAQGGEAAEESGPALWKFVADELWGKDMAAALSTGGVLDGGDWNEGWQYGPFSVAEYALAARIGKAYGLATNGITPWLDSVLRRHVYALTPGDRLWAGGDYDDDHAYMSPQVLVLDAISLGDASPDDKRWAKGELSRLSLTDKDALLYDALAVLGDPPALVPREAWPTWYQAAATGTLFTRTSWDARAIWFVAACAQTSGLDHRGPNAGNFVLSRGAADLIVDPSPYGSLSTLTGNAPTVRSGHKLANYVPSQLAWSEDIAWVWATKTTGGIVAARCDYSDAYRFQDRKSDVPVALRDFVLVPSADGHDASLVIVDRATTGAVDHKMYLRFRVPAELAIDQAGTGTATIKDARVTISGAHAPSLGRTKLKDCFQEGTKRGNCDAARFPVTDYRVEIPGPEPRALHVIDATGATGGATHSALSGDGWTGVRVQGTRDAAVVWPNEPGGALAVRAPKGQPGKRATLVVLDAPASDGKATVSAKPDGDACAVTIAAGGTIPAKPVIVTLDAACAVAADPEQPNGVSAESKPVAPRRTPSPRRGGCCGAQNAPGSPLAMSLVVLVVLWRRRRRPV
jgi:MYXO-CTERM domain-containing protein